ncbi:beta strand repeat-containing protein [Burkholderia orbicola]|uniref:beta strand repeat-containing protein n=1 Tax=Burkholderia orbicola TaxID=2978683 RepID=UPI0039A59488
MLYNNATANGTSTGSRGSAATEAGIQGSTDGHLSLLGGSGVHIMGPADFNNNVNMTNHRITGLAAGTAGTDAVNLNQLNAAISGTGASPYVKINSSSQAAAATGDNAVAIGQTVTSAGSSSIAMGSDTTASGLHSIALGASAKNVGTADRQIAIGSVAQTSGQYATAMGYMASAAGADAMAFGRASSATTSGAMSIGTVATSSGTGSIALGNGAVAKSGSGGNIAIGQSAIADAGAGVGATAIGTSARAGSPGYSGATAIGLEAQANYGNAALGRGAQAIGSTASIELYRGVLAIGDTATATAGSSVALGYNSLSDRANSVSVGRTGAERQIVNVAAGTQNTDAVNLGQMNAAIAATAASPYVKVNATRNAAAATGDNAVAIGQTVTSAGSSSIAMGSDTTASGLHSIALGASAKNVGTADRQIAIGSVAQTSGQYATAVGYMASAAGADAMAFGRASSATTSGAMSIGTVATSSGTGSIALGNGAVAKSGSGGNIAIGQSAIADAGAGVGATAIGTSARAGSPGYSGATAIGLEAQANYGNAALGRGAQAIGSTASIELYRGVLAIGDTATATAGSSVALGYNSLSDRANSVSVGRTGAERQIVNVAAGTQNMDAVNVSQLTGVTKALGGGAVVGVDGSITQPTYKVGGSDYHNVGDALDALASSGVGDPNAVTYDDATKRTVTLGGTGAVAPIALKNVADAKDDHDALNLGQLKNAGLVGDDGTGNLTSMAVTYDSAVKDKVTLDGAAGTTLSNVKAGVADMDAVNVSQLKGAGLIGDDGKSIAAVTYDRHADGTPNYGSVTLGNGTGPTQMKNVAAGVEATDAVNMQQMQRAVVEGNPYIGGRGIGVAAKATGINAVALGLGSVADEINTISVGNGATGLQRRITNVQNGEANSDAATVGQVNDLIGVASTSATSAINDIDAKTRVAIQDMNSRLNSINTAASADPYVQVDGTGDGSDNAFAGAGTFGVAIGAEASATGTTAIAIGAQSVSSGTGSVALGAGASATATGAVAFGSGRATGTSALALGNGTAASGNNAVAAGFNAQASGLNGLALGNTSRANATDSMAFGAAAQVDRMATNSIAIGRDANVTGVAQNSVALGSGSAADRLNSISIGSTGQQRQIIYVARGTADTDAVNVSQLKDAMSSFGGTAAVGTDGSIVNPTYSIGGKTYRNVGDALNALAALGGGGADPLAVTYGTDAGGAPNFEIVSLKGADGTTLSNVKAGVADMDAVNVSQLKGSGLIGDDGKSIAAVTYDRNADGTPNYGSVTLGHGEGPTQLKNVADATDDGDALNLGQLKDAGLVGDDGAGNLTSMAVTYDGAAKDSVTLGGAGATTPVALHNVADGVLSADSKDAVNGSQLFATNTRVGDLEDSLSKGGVIDPVTGESLAVVYDGNVKDTVTLKGVDGTTLSNVKAGVADMDAVNVSQLKGSGLIGDDGKSIAAVTYDRNADGTPNYGSVTLGHGEGPTQLKNVADATDDGDALNLGQLKDAGLVGDDGAGNLTSMAVTYDGAAKDSVTLGGAGATTPVALHNVADGVLSADSKDAVNGSQLFATNTRVGDLEDSLSKGGVIDPVTGESLAVVYDGNAKDTTRIAPTRGPTWAWPASRSIRSRTWRGCSTASRSTARPCR